MALVECSLLRHRKFYGENVKPTGSYLLGAIYWAMLRFSVSVGLCAEAKPTQLELIYVYLYLRGASSLFFRSRMKCAVGCMACFLPALAN